MTDKQKDMAFGIFFVAFTVVLVLFTMRYAGLG